MAISVSNCSALTNRSAIDLNKWDLVVFERWQLWVVRYGVLYPGTVRSLEVVKGENEVVGSPGGLVGGPFVDLDVVAPSVPEVVDFAGTSAPARMST